MNKKCAIMACYYAKNYGSILTAYALYKLVSKLGFEPYFIYTYKPMGFAIDFFKSLKEKINFTRACLNVNDFKRLNKIFNTYICGSDAQINYTILKERFYRNLFAFAPVTKKKLLIAGSKSPYSESLTNEEFEDIKQMLNSLDYTSFREINTYNDCKEFFNVDGEWILDPVFLIDKSEYLSLIEEEKLSVLSNQIMSYILYPTEEKNNIVEYLAKKDNAKIIEFKGNEYTEFFSTNKSKYNVQNWLKSILNSSLIISDSFHCVCFAIIFNKKFLYLKNPVSNGRFESLFHLFNLNYPVISNIEEYKDNEELLYKINYEEINKIIENKKLININTIKTKLEEEKIPSNKQIIAQKYIDTNIADKLKKINKWYKINRFVYLNFIEIFIEPFFRRLIELKRRWGNKN